MRVLSYGMTTALLLGAVAGSAGAQASPTRPVPVTKNEVSKPSASAPAQPGVICTLEARPALQVTVQDENGAALPSLAGVRAIARKGSYADTATVLPGSALKSLALAYERDGYFTVEVSAPGYAEATLPNILVTRTYNGCHVVTRQLTVTLHR